MATLKISELYLNGIGNTGKVVLVGDTEDMVWLSRLPGGTELYLGHINMTTVASSGASPICHVENRTPAATTHQKHDYGFHLPHPDMLDVAKVQEELSMERPLAILGWDGKVGYVFAQQVKDKAKALGIKTGVQKKDWFPDHRHTKQVVDAVRKVVHAPWPNKPQDATCKVTLVEV